MSLQICRVDGEHVLERPHGLSVLPLEEQQPPHLVPYHSIARIGHRGVLQVSERRVIAPLSLERQCEEETESYEQFSTNARAQKDVTSIDV